MSQAVILQSQHGPVVLKPTAEALRASVQEYERDARGHAARADELRAARDLTGAAKELESAARKLRIARSYQLEAEQLERGSAS